MKSVYVNHQASESLWSEMLLEAAESDPLLFARWQGKSDLYISEYESQEARQGRTRPADSLVIQALYEWEFRT